MVSWLLTLLWLLSVPGQAPGTQPPTFYRDVLPILETHCQGCHRPGEIAPFALIGYADVKPRAAEVARVTAARIMPPWFADPAVGHFSNDPSLGVAQIATIQAWVKAGAPAGDPRDAPPPPAAPPAAGWLIPQPQQVLAMPRPVDIPAHGTVDYTWEIVPTGFTTDHWVRAAELRPALRANVHHAVVYVRPPGSDWLHGAPVGVPFTAAQMSDPRLRRDAQETTADLLLVYAPGSAPDNWPATLGKLIPAGSDLVFQMHYTTNGHAGADRTSLGLIYDAAPPPQRVLTLQLNNTSFVIPPGDPDSHVEAHGTLPHACTLLSFFPHMHLRGKEFAYNLLEPGADGRTHVVPLLRVHYDFFWQLSYRLATPLPLAAGTVLQAVGDYDNSAANPHNPDPTVAVYWGDRTSEEMFVGFFDVAVPASMTKERFFARSAPAP